MSLQKPLNTLHYIAVFGARTTVGWISLAIQPSLINAVYTVKGKC